MLRGDIYLVDLVDGQGSEQSGIRPALIIQNNVGNAHSPTTIIAPITSKEKTHQPTHVDLSKKDGVIKDSTVLLEQIRVVDKSRLLKKLGEVKNQEKINDINRKIIIAMGIGT